ncbi:MAG: FtsX-like permease family protein [Ilumatobacteraceae bacterium]|nr:FtsX-like permease family protein [Ilumatobacteraceae bacterium]
MFLLAVKMTLARTGRLVLTSLAVILGTAFLSGTFVFRDTINQTFDRLFADVFRDVNAYVRSTTFLELDFGGEQRAATPVSVLETVRGVAGVTSATGDIQAFARVIGKDGEPLGSEGNGPPTFGGIASSDSAGLWSITEGRLPVGSNEVVLDKATADNGDFVVGDNVRVVAVRGTREFTLVGIASYGDISSPGGATFALFDQPTASEFLLQPGFVDAILVEGDDSVSDEMLAQRIDAALSADLKLETLTGAEITAEVQGQIKDVLNIFSTFLIVFSYIALGIGSFVIYNVFSITAAQRLRENALLRAIGASRRQVSRALLVESTAMGVVGSVIGFGIGILLSQLLSALLKATGFEVPTQGLAISTSAFVNTFVAGVLVTVLAAWLPARRAGRVPPLAALRDTALDSAGNITRRVIVGLIIVALGGVGLVSAMRDAPIQILGLGVLGVFTGILVLGPAIARPVALTLGIPVAKLRGVSGAMARQNAARNPKRTSRTAAPVLLGVALVTAFTALAASIRSEIRDTFGDAFSGDIALTVDSRGFGGIPLTITDQIADLDGVAQATGVGFTSVRLSDPNEPPALTQVGASQRGVFVQTINPATITGLFDLGVTEGNLSSLGKDGIFVAASRATEKGWEIGTRLQVTRADGVVIDAEIRGFVSGDTSFANYVTSREMFADSSASIFDAFVYIKVAEGSVISEVQARVAAISSDAGIGTLLSKEEFIDDQAAQINQILALIYGLLGLSIIIAIVGIVITLLLSVFERRREIGLLRAVGMTKSQVRTTVRWESVITSLLGAVSGVVLGVVMGVVVVAALADEGGIAFRLPINETLSIMFISFVLGVLAAVYPAWRATRVNVVEAIATA